MSAFGGKADAARIFEEAASRLYARQSDISLAVAVLVDTIQSANSVTCDARGLMFMNWLIIITMYAIAPARKKASSCSMPAHAQSRAQAAAGTLFFQTNKRGTGGDPLTLVGHGTREFDHG